MELNYSEIEIGKSPETVMNVLKTFIKKGNDSEEKLIEIFDYGISLLRKEDLDLKLELLRILFDSHKKLEQLMEEFGKSSDLLKALYELTSMGFISQKSFHDNSPYYREHEYFFEREKFFYKIRKNLEEKKSILESEKEIIQTNFLFKCDVCNKLYNYIEAINNNFMCCGRIHELNQSMMISEIDFKINLIDTKLKILDRI
jgi:transcription initiation factor IIE alpha subunit